MKGFEIIAHTADTGIKAYGQSLKELFTNAALGMFAIIASEDLPLHGKEREFRVEKKASGIENVLVDWLDELLFLFSTEDVVFDRFDIKEIRDDYILAYAFGTDSRNFNLQIEVKAVTYHMLRVQKQGEDYSCQVIFDV